MKHGLILLLITLTPGYLRGQVITKLHNGVSTFYYDVNDLPNIVASALDNDTIILPGGPIACTDILVTKPLTFIGAGMLDDSTQVTGRTVLTYIFNEPLNIQPGGSNSSFHGMDIQRDVMFGDGVSSITFERCAFNDFVLGEMNDVAASNVHLKHCLFRSGIASNGGSGSTLPQGLLVENCIIEGGIHFGANNIASAQVTQCILLDMTTATNENAGVTFTNNIFTRYAGLYSFNSASTYACNLFCMTTGTTLSWTGATDQGGNIGWQLTSNNVFVDVPTYSDYDEDYDYHLAIGSPGASLTCTLNEAGIYGGPFGASWKEGGIPFNPHWVSFPASLGTSNGGVINVNFSGAAQQD